MKIVKLLVLFICILTLSFDRVQNARLSSKLQLHDKLHQEYQGFSGIVNDNENGKNWIRNFNKFCRL